MSSPTHVSSSAPTQFLEAKGGERYAYRRFGNGPGLPLLLLQHFTDTLDNWDPALTDTLGEGRELILSLFQYHESFARHAAAFLSVTSESAVY